MEIFGHKVTMEEKEGIPVINVEGTVDFCSADSLGRQIDIVIEAGAKDIIINLSQTDFLDSTAIFTLITSLNRLRKANDDDSSIVLVCSDNHPRRVLTQSGLCATFDICSEIQEAVQKIETA